MLFSSSKIAAAFACSLALATSPALGDDAAKPLPIRISGFGTLGVARSSVDTAEFVRDLSQPRGLTRRWSGDIDSVLGIQAELALGQQTDAAVQVLSRYRYDGSYAPEVSWAFLRHDFSSDVQLRVGRLGTEFYMLGDSRLIGYANPTVRPPADFYGLLVFNHFDGFDFTAKADIGGGFVRAKLFAGRSPETTPFVAPLTWDLAGTRLRGGYLEYARGPWQTRMSHTSVRFDAAEAPFSPLLNSVIAADPVLSGLLGPLLPLDIVALIPELRMAGTTSRFDSLGVVYDKGPLQVQAMLGRIRHQTESYEDSRAAFVTAAYRVGEFTPFVGYSAARSKAASVTTVPAALGPLGGVVNQLAAQALPPSSHIDRRTVSVGARWDFRANWAIKVQHDAVRGTPASISPFRATPGVAPRWDGRMRVLSATLDFVF